MSELLETLVWFVRIAVGVGLLALGTFFALLSVAGIHVMIALIKAGPRVADEALVSGASLSKWWRGGMETPAFWKRYASKHGWLS